MATINIKVSTGRYLPYSLAVAPDGTIWTLGYEADTSNADWRIDQNANVLRHFDSAGNLLKSAISFSDFKLLQRSMQTPRGMLAATTDRLGWYGSPGDGNAVYVEVSLQDFSVKTYPGASAHPDKFDMTLKLALTESGATALSIEKHSPDTRTTYILDSSVGKWVAIDVPRLGDFAFVPHLIGTDNERLVFQYAQESAFFKIQR